MRLLCFLSGQYLFLTAKLTWRHFVSAKDMSQNKTKLSLCSSPLRARASTVYGLCKSQISRPTKSTEMGIIYYSSLVHYGNLCVVAIANVETEKNI